MDQLIMFLASILIWFMFVGLVVLWVIDGKVKKEITIHALFSSMVAWGLAEMIKSLIPTARPFMVNGKEPLTLAIPLDGAFPSAHTAIAFAIAVSIWMHNKRYGTIFGIMALLVGIGRVAGNVHYPMDILGGGAVGIIGAIIMKRIHLPIDS